ncbi:MAG: hypothetical protein EBS36_03655 [Actinobacteria bacterium]|nr:hypothetical protein [Actinomycetota bacterium]NBY16054.1 hypothetical protein [Actinomycetota bacterium]
MFEYSKRDSARNSFALLAFSILFTFTASLCNPSLAAVKGTSSKAQVVTSTGWGAYLAPAGSTPSPGPYVNTWIATPGTQLAYLDLLNPNTVALSGVNFNLSSVEPNSSRQNVPRVTFDVCVGATWNATTDTCSGTITNLGTSTGGTVNSSIVIGANARLSVRLTVGKTTKISWTTTINVLTGRAQVRAAITTNS